MIGLQLQGNIPEGTHYYYTPVRGCNGNVSKMRHQVIYIVECWLCCSLLYLIRVYHHTRSDQILGTILYAFEKYHLKLKERPKLLLERSLMMSTACIVSWIEIAQQRN